MGLTVIVAPPLPGHAEGFWMRSKSASRTGAEDKVTKVQHVNDTLDAGQANLNIPVYIGDKLKALYSEVVNQPVPDHLLDLVTRLESQSKGG